MLERYLIDHCSPTLASLKTANMFICPYESGESLEEDVRKWNLQMKDKGLYLTILRKNDKKHWFICAGHRDWSRIFINREYKSFCGRADIGENTGKRH